MGLGRWAGADGLSPGRQHLRQSVGREYHVMLAGESCGCAHALWFSIGLSAQHINTLFLKTLILILI